MQRHNITMIPHGNSYEIYYNNDCIGKWLHPKIDAAKWLIAQELAVVEDTLILIYKDEIVAEEKIYSILGLSPLQKPVIVEKIVERIVEKIVEVPTRIEIREKIIYMDKIVYKEKLVTDVKERERIKQYIAKKYARYLSISRAYHKEYRNNTRQKIKELTIAHEQKMQASKYRIEALTLLLKKHNILVPPPYPPNWKPHYP